MTSIITGSTGFIAKKLIEKLRSTGEDFLPLNREDGDLTICPLEDIVQKEKDINNVYHLAARTFVPSAWNNPEDFIKENVASTLNVLHYCRLNKLPLIYMSAYIYGKQEILPIKESAIINPSNPYAQSKLLGEKICKYYADVFSLDITILRPFNVYGPDQEKHFLIPEIIGQINKSKKIIVNSLNPKRDFVFIDDLVEAMIISSKKLKGFQVYNIGSGNSVSVREIIELLEDLIKKPLEYEERGLERQGEMMDVVADISAANKSLSWTPKINLREGLKKMLVKEGLCT
jgi:GDP-4-dehydro-6-deoxy-D-mannose reductase